MSNSITEKAISGVNWNFLNTFGTTFLSIIVGIVLARLLPPADFGLLGMAYIFISLATVFSTLGMGPAVIRFTNLTDEHIRVATTVTFTFGLLIFFLFYIFAPLISEFFKEEKLIKIIRVISILFLLQGLSSISDSILVRRIDFKSKLFIEVSAYIAGQGILSIVLAIMGYGVWSLVVGRLVTGAMISVLLIIKVPLKVKPLWRKKEFYELAGFGTGASFSNLVHYAAANVDYMVIGRYGDPTALGLYTRAYNLMSMPLGQVNNTLYNVVFSTYSAIQNDYNQLKNAFLRSIRSISFLLLPVLAAMIICAKYIILGLYGYNWGGAISAFQILCVAGLLKATLSFSGALALAIGKVYQELWRQVVHLVILTAGALYGVRYGIEGVGWAVVAAFAWLFISQGQLSLSILKLRWSDYFKTQIPGLINSLIISLVDIIFINLIEYSIPSVTIIIKFIILLVVSGITLLASLIWIPESIKGDSAGWIIDKYGRFIPSKIKTLYYRFN